MIDNEREGYELQTLEPSVDDRRENQCQGVKKDGTPCTQGAMAASDYCFWHSGDTKAIQRATSRGGKIAAKRKDAERWLGKISIGNLEDVREILTNLLVETHDKTISPQTCSACVGVLKEFRELLTDVILAEKVKSLHEYLTKKGLLK